MTATPHKLAPEFEVIRGYLVGFPVDDTRMCFMCRLCGAASEPVVALAPLPEHFAGVPHTSSCAIYGKWATA